MPSKTNQKVKKSAKTLSGFSKFWRVVLAAFIPLVAGFLISLLTRNAQESFGRLNQPPFAPPAWLFPVAWTILYFLMGIASYLIYMSGRLGTKNDQKYAKTSLIIYSVQLVFNLVWSPIFFNLEWYWFAFGWLVVMWILIVILIIRAKKQSTGAFFCLLPYLLWVTFAGYLNCAIAILN